MGDDLDGLQAQSVNLTAAAMKSVGGKWLVEMHEYISSNPQIVVNGFHNAGIPNTIDASTVIAAETLRLSLTIVVTVMIVLQVSCVIDL